jgi:hypothetical protein
MAVPSSNISISNIYSEPNGSSPGSGSDIKVSDLFKKSYFEGPPFGSTISYSAWGQYGSTSGADRIYGLTAKNTNNAFGDFSGLTYWYDNSSYKIAARIRNTKQGPPYPPPPPFYDNNVGVEIWVSDSSGTYDYITSGSILATVPNYDQTTTLSTSGSTPIIAIGYWRVRFTVNETFPGGGANVIIDINGTNYVNSTAGSNGQTTFTSSTYGTASIAATGQGYTGLYFDIRIQ